jgi:hypothetical protein
MNPNLNLNMIPNMNPNMNPIINPNLNPNMNPNMNMGSFGNMKNTQNQMSINQNPQTNMNSMGSFNGLNNMNNVGQFIQIPNSNSIPSFMPNPNMMQNGFFNPNQNNFPQSLMSNQQNSLNVNVNSIPNNQQSRLAPSHNIPSLPINIPAISNSFIIPQQGINMFSNEIAHQNTLNQLGLNVGENFSGINQKRGISSIDKDQTPDLELKNEQVSDVSVKRFRSGEDILWDFDYDKSKRDLEDFIFRTHNAIKNNSYVDTNNTTTNTNTKFP